MRITGGEFRGRILEAPKNDAIRPTSDKARLAVFNMLNSRGLVEDAIVLDAFCGTGALGIEAMSWGAQACVFVDKNRTSLDLAKRNCAMLGLKETVKFQLRDSAKAGAKPDDIPVASLVFLDPPYRKNLVPESLESLQSNGWLDQSVSAVIETEREFDPALLTAMGYDILVTKDYGDTKIVLAQR